MTLSIVVPSYNQAQFLGQCLDSIIGQLRPDDELFVIDGGSTDGTLTVIERFQKYISYWRSEPDAGQVWAINYGMRLSTQPIVAWINSDDYYLSGAFDFVRQCFDVSRYDMIYGDVHIVDQHNKMIRRAWHGYWDPVRLVHGNYDIDQQACFWTRSWWHKLGGLNEKLYFCFDVERHYTDALRGVRARHFPRFVAAYRRHPATKSTRAQQIRHCELSRLKKEYQPKFPTSSLSYKCRVGLRHLYAVRVSRGAILMNLINRKEKNGHI